MQTRACPSPPSQSNSHPLTTLLFCLCRRGGAQEAGGDEEVCGPENRAGALAHKCVCAAVIKDEERRRGSAGQTNTMHALWVLTGRRLAPCNGRQRVATDCTPRASPFPLAAGVWRPACSAAMRAQVTATLTRRHGWPGLAPLQHPGRIDKGVRSSGRAKLCQHLHQALTGAWRRM